MMMVMIIDLEKNSFLFKFFGGVLIYKQYLISLEKIQRMCVCERNVCVQKKCVSAKENSDVTREQGYQYLSFPSRFWDLNFQLWFWVLF